MGEQIFKTSKSVRNLPICESPRTNRPTLTDLLHPDVKDSLERYVSSQDYLVSSLFCLFESYQIANTVTVLDAGGKEVGQDGDIGAWTLLMTKYFASMREPGKQGKNPFVLGYGVVQNPARTVPPPEFAPKSFQLSTTSNGIPTLNFLLVTDDRKISVEDDPSAGRFSQSFFTTINSASHDGILAICAKQIVEGFIVKTIGPAFWFGTPTIQSHKLKNQSDSLVVGSENYSRHIQWGSDWNEWDDTILNYRDSWDGNLPSASGIWDCASQLTDILGESLLSMDWTSDSQINPALVAPADATRRMYVNISGELKFNYHRESVSKGLGLLIIQSFPPRIANLIACADNWSEAFSATVTAPYRTRLDISPGKDGAWIVERNNSLTFFPEVDSNHKIVLKEGRNFWHEAHGFFKLLDFIE